MRREAVGKIRGVSLRQFPERDIFSASAMPKACALRSSSTALIGSERSYCRYVVRYIRDSRVQIPWVREGWRIWRAGMPVAVFPGRSPAEWMSRHGFVRSVSLGKVRRQRRG